MAPQQTDSDSFQFPATDSSYNSSFATKDRENGRRGMTGYSGDESGYHQGMREIEEPQHTRMRTGYNVGLRLITLAACIAAFVVMITNKQTVIVPVPISNGVFLTVRAKWQYSSAFVWFVIATGFVALYTLVSLIVVACLASMRTGSRWALKALLWALFILDLVMVQILMSALGAAIAIALIGQYGNSHTGWVEICNTVSRFCNHTVGALAPCGVAYINYLQLTVLHAYHLHIFYKRRS